MLKKPGFIIFSITGLIFLLLKFWYASANNEDLGLFLKPTSNLVSLMTGSKWTMEGGYIYYFKNLHITIEKSCSGFNFFLISFVVLAFSIRNLISSFRIVFLAIPILVV